MSPFGCLAEMTSKYPTVNSWFPLSFHIQACCTHSLPQVRKWHPPPAGYAGLGIILDPSLFFFPQCLISNLSASWDSDHFTPPLCRCLDLSHHPSFHTSLLLWLGAPCVYPPRRYLQRRSQNATSPFKPNMSPHFTQSKCWHLQLFCPCRTFCGDGTILYL